MGHKEKLEEVYALALKQENVELCLMVLDRLEVSSCNAKAEVKK